jgi:hypothetical protein
VCLYDNQGLSHKSLNIGVLLKSITEVLLVLILAIIFYFFWFLRKSNYDQMVYFFRRAKFDGFYYYSQEPANAYYDKINTPMGIYSYENIFLLVLVIFALLVVIDTLSTITTEKKKMTSCSRTMKTRSQQRYF